MTKRIKKTIPVFPGFPHKPTRGKYWQYPQILDKWWFYLTPSEHKVLDFILRQTWGFQRSSNRISYSQFLKGIGKLIGGVGIGSTATLSKALRGLCSKGFIRKMGEPKKLQIYHLVLEEIYEMAVPDLSRPGEHKIIKVPTSEYKAVTASKTKNTINTRQYKEKDISSLTSSYLLEETIPKEDYTRYETIEGLLLYAEKAKKRPYTEKNRKRQAGAITEMLDGGFIEKDIKEKWDELSSDDFRSRNGFDFWTVCNELNKMRD